MNKLQSLKNLKDWDFNVPNFIEYDRSWTVPKLLEKFGRSRLAVRSCLRNEGIVNFGCPFIYDIPAEDTQAFATKTFEQGYIVIIYEYVPKEWSLISGHIQFDVDLSGFYEVYRGTGVVRDIMTKTADEMEHAAFSYKNAVRDVDIRGVVEEAADIVLFERKPLIVEFSLGSEVAGTKQELLVFWEYRYV